MYGKLFMSPHLGFTPAMSENAVSLLYYTINSKRACWNISNMLVHVEARRLKVGQQVCAEVRKRNGEGTSKCLSV